MRLEEIIQKAEKDEKALRGNCAIRAFSGSDIANALATLNKLVAELAKLVDSERGAAHNTALEKAAAVVHEEWESQNYTYICACISALKKETPNVDR